jgi:hypothetical protein
MNEIERSLRRVAMRGPSASYLDRGLARIAGNDGRSKRVSANWRYATIGLAILLSASLILNVVDRVGQGPGISADTPLAFNILRREGEMMIYESGYLYPPDSGDPE